MKPATLGRAARRAPLTAAAALLGVVLLCAVVLLAAGCGRKAGKAGASAAAQRRERLIRELAPQKQLTLSPELAPERATFKSFVGPCSLMVGYLPEGWITSTPSDCRRFVIRPVRHGRAYASAAVAVEFAPAGMDSAEVYAHAVAEDLVAWQWRDEHRDPWTLREADFARWVKLKHAVGRTLVGRHGDRYFWISAYYPLEIEDYVLPRFRAILDTWVWTDSGEPLDPRRAKLAEKKPRD